MKRVLITGGTRGIGRACVAKFAENGWETVVLYKSSDSAARELEASYGSLCIKCDVSSPAEVKTAFSAAGDIDVLVNNAGISYTGLLQDMTDGQWDEIMNTNLSSAFYTTREAIPIMLRRGEGGIINVSSMWGVTGASCEVAYSAAKAGLIGFTKALAKELAPSNIRVNAVAPGAIMTDMLSGYSETDLQAIADDTPIGRLGTPGNIADAVFFLASDKACFITGEVINVNGGYVI